MPPTTPANTSVCSEVICAARQRPGAGARHQRIDLLLDQAVHRRRRAGHQRDAQRARKQDGAPAPCPASARNMPITAVNTISDTTRGLVSA